MDLHACGRDYRATYRDGVMSVGPEGYAEFDYDLGYRVAGWDEANARHNHHETQGKTDKSINQEQVTLQPGAHGTKRSASSPLPHDPEFKKTKTVSAVNNDHGNQISSVDKTGFGSRARTETPSKPEPDTQLSETKTTAPAITADDDSELEIVEVRSSSALKRKSSLTSTPGPAKKRSKQAGAPETEEDSDLPKAKRAALNEMTTRHNATTSSKTARAQVHNLDDESGESGRDASSAESEYEDGQETEGLKTARKLARANRDFDQSCKRCKADANKALKTKHEQEITKLKKEYKEHLKTLNTKAQRAVRDVKATAEQEKKAIKDKCQDSIDDVKGDCEQKMTSLKNKHDTTLGTLQEKYSEEKQKNKELTRQRDEAHETRKKAIEKAAAEVKDARNDLEAGERSLAEQKKQVLREKREEISQLKPEHSKVVKVKDIKIKEMTQKVAQLEKDLKGNERHLYDVRKEGAAEKQRHSNCKTELAQAKRHIADVEKDVKECKAFAEKTQHRTETDKVRAKEKIELAIANRNEQNERLILSQRENYQLKDQVRQLAQRGREIRDELEKLKIELKSTKAELGVAKDLEGMDDALGHEASATMASPSGDMVFFE
jgi:hypothetical protein